MSSSSFAIGGASSIAGTSKYVHRVPFVSNLLINITTLRTCEYITVKLSSSLPSKYVTFNVQAYISGYATTVFSTNDINVCGGGFKALSSTSCPNKGLYYFGTDVNLPSSPITVSNIKLGVTASDSSGSQIMDCTFNVSIESNSYNMTASIVVCGAGIAVLVGALFIKRRSRKIGVIDASVLNDFTQMDDDAVTNIEFTAPSTLNTKNSVIV